MSSGNLSMDNKPKHIDIYVRIKKGTASDEDKMFLEMWYNMVCIGKDLQIKLYEDYIHKHPEVMK